MFAIFVRVLYIWVPICLCLIRKRARWLRVSDRGLDHEHVLALPMHLLIRASPSLGEGRRWNGPPLGVLSFRISGRTLRQRRGRHRLSSGYRYCRLGLLVRHRQRNARGRERPASTHRLAQIELRLAFCSLSILHLIIGVTLKSVQAPSSSRPCCAGYCR
ncbi:hypothetical protein N8I77_010449 [Diaporthe amygdali]|uniref:Uncharacterized protein n=1 Tax=Phomopsis amygdali TaxID=1214568 RepID=A0AAD9S710_PHOAM|nr:hypothetical protein N8I77_010449 [Diaporthe amygdali]